MSPASTAVADPPLSCAAPPTPLGFLDDAQEWSAFSRPSPALADCWESTVVIEGMHCAACAGNVEAALKAVPGVVSAEVSGARQRALVVWSAKQVMPSAWMEAVQQGGYRALPANDRFAAERRKAESRRALWRWLVAGLCMMQVMMYAYPAYIAVPGDLSGEMEQLLRWASWVLTLPVILFSCGPFFKSALADLTHRRIGMDLPVAMGIAITFAVSSLGTFAPTGVFGREVYFDSLTMFVFFLLTGRWLELRLRDRTAGALEALSNRLPDSVERLQPDGRFERVAARRVVVGDVLRVRAGEAFVADGVVVLGQTLVDEALLTGESHPLPRGEGDAVVAGSHNLSASVQVRVQRTGQATRFAQIAALMESAAHSKPQSAQLADRLAKPFLLAVLVSALLACLWWWPRDPAHALMVAVAVLVVTCPCALSLATPAAMLASAAALARRGVLVRRLQALEALAGVDTFVFDKTGTLTRDGMVVGTVTVRAGVPVQQVLAQVAALASHSLHPVSRALCSDARVRQAAEARTTWSCRGATERPGQGVTGEVGDTSSAPSTVQTMRLGSAAFCGVERTKVPGSFAYLSDGQGWLATFEVIEDLRPLAAQTLATLQQELGMAVQVLSGDSEAAVQRIAAALGGIAARGDCSPDEKLAHLRQLQAQGHRVAMVGDGLNDGPVLAGANVSFAFGQSLPLAQARADFVVMGEQLVHVADTLRLAKRTMQVVRQNLCWALLYNAACVPLAVMGLLPAWLAGLGMALSSLAVVGNALRLAGGGGTMVAPTETP